MVSGTTMVIVYCETCGHRITDSELTSGARMLDENKFLCPKCAAAQSQPVLENAVVPSKRGSGGAPLPERGSGGNKTLERKSPKGNSLPRDTRITHAHSPETRSSRQYKPAKQPEAHSPGKPASNGMVTGSIIFGIGTLAAIGLYFMGGRSETPQVKSDSKSTVPLPVPQNKDMYSAPRQTPETAERPTPRAPVLGKSDDDEDAARLERIAAGALQEAEKFRLANPHNAWGYRDKLQPIAGTYRSTASGRKAIEILSNLKDIGEPPKAEPAVGVGDWLPLFDGKSADVFNFDSGGRWKLVDGALENVPSVNNAPQLRHKLSDGQIRFKFEYFGAEYAFFIVRLDGANRIGLQMNTSWLRTLGENKAHELIFTCLEDSCTASMDGTDIALNDARGKPRTGSIQFNFHGTKFRMLAIDHRPVMKKSDAAPGPEKLKDSDWIKAINLLSMVDPAKDALAGTWTLVNGELHCTTRERYARVQFPLKPPEEYDFRIVFSRKIGDADIAQVCSINGTPFRWVMSGYENTLAGFDYDGDVNNKPSTTKHTLENGRKYTSVVQVRRDCSQAFIDGALVSTWKTDYKDVDMLRYFKLRDPALIGVASQQNEMVFHSAQLLEIKGKALNTR
jgi:hypothetical protein